MHLQLPAFELGAMAGDTSNRLSLDGLTLKSQADGALVVGIEKFEAAALRLASGPLVMEVGRLVVRKLVGHVRLDQAGRPRTRWEAADAELSRLKVHGPLVFSREPKGPLHAPEVQADPRPAVDTAAGTAATEAWCLAPLAAADGRIRAQIVDAHLLFDADVTVPIRRGKVDFNETTVEHVGPDSRMGVSRLGLYVDAPNGRSYIYQFSTAPVGGVQFERRDALLGAWVADRGNLQVQAFAEGLLRQARAGRDAGFTDEARLLFDRTAVSGDVQLSDGRFAAPGIQGELVGRAEGRNAIRLHSEAVGRGLTVEMPSLSVVRAACTAGGAQLECDEITATLILRLSGQGTQLRFAFDAPTLKISRLRVHEDAARDP